MSSSHRLLERLPASVFDTLIAVDLELDGDEGGTVEKFDETSSGLVLQRRICAKLKVFPRKVGGRNKPVAVRHVGDFLRIPEASLVRGLDPLLTFGMCGGRLARSYAFSLCFISHYHSVFTSPAECRELRQRICLLCAARPATLLSLLPKRRRLNDSAAMKKPGNFSFVSSGIPRLDQNLLGGFRVGSITEIVGRAGSGKTQLAMQLCLQVAKEGMAAAYIDTEGKFSLDRFCEMASGQLASSLVVAAGPQGDSRPPDRRSVNLAGQNMDALSRLLLYSSTTMDDLRCTLSSVEVEAYLRGCEAEGEEGEDKGEDNGNHTHGPRLGLLIVDSIAAPARREFGKGEVAARAQGVMNLASLLKRLSEKLNIAVVVVNQIGGISFQKDDWREEQDDKCDTSGALGNSWHHCASTRLVIERITLPDAENGGTQREISVSKSSRAKQGSRTTVVLNSHGFTDV
jgi:RecA/RadA recombinase